MNTRRFNQWATTHLTKRWRTGTYCDAIPVDDEFDKVAVREETVTSRKMVRVTERVIQRDTVPTV